MSQTATTRRRRQFKLKPGTILNLAVVLIVAIGLAIYYRPPRPIIPSVDVTARMTNEAVPVPTVLDSRADDMSRIEFTRGDVAFTLEHTGEHWAVTVPFEDRADDTLVARLAEYVAGIAFDEEITEPAAASTYGLDAPLISAELTLADGTVQTVAIAQPEGAVEYYVQTSASDSVYLVRNLPERLFTIIASEMIYGQLLDFSPADVRQITAIGADGERKVIEREGNSWFSDTEYGRALVFDVEVFLRDLHGLTGSSIAATEGQQAWEQLGLAPTPETMHIELQLADGSVRTLDVGSTTADGRRYYVRSSDRPHAYIVVEFSAVNLDRKLAAATTDILSINTARVTNVTVTSSASNGTQVVRAFQRDRDNHSQWTSERRVAFYVPQLLENVNGVTTFQRAPEASESTFGFGATGNGLSLQLTMENNAVYVLDIGNATSDGRYVYVRSSGREGAYLASVDAVQAIRDGLGIIRTDLLPFDATQLTQIEVASVTGGQTTVKTLAQANGSWTLDGGAADAARVQTMLTQLRGLQAEKIPAVVPEEQYKFFPTDGSLRATLRSANGDELILDIGGSVQEGTGWFSTTSYYVRVNDLEEVVFISERNHRDLRNAITAAIQ